MQERGPTDESDSEHSEEPAQSRSESPEGSGTGGPNTTGRDFVNEIPHQPQVTLEQVIAGADFARRGWHRLFELADYLAHLVDGRTTGVLVIERRNTYVRVHGLATTVKAALQWFVLDDAPRPKFVVEAESYLADGAATELIRSPPTAPADHQRMMRSGPVAPRTGGRGAAGRLHAVTDLRNRIVELLQPLTQEDLHIHQGALDGGDMPKQGWILAPALADIVLFAIMDGLCADLLREQGFEWPPWDNARSELVREIANMLDDADLGGELGPARHAHLEALAEQLIQGALSALGARVDKELFRERRKR